MLEAFIERYVISVELYLGANSPEKSRGGPSGASRDERKVGLTHVGERRTDLRRNGRELRRWMVAR